MLLFGVTIPTTIPQRSEIPEGLMNYPVNNAQLGPLYHVMEYTICDAVVLPNNPRIESTMLNEF